MGVEYKDTSLPDTLRTLERNSDAYHVTDTLFITPEDFTFTEDEGNDNDFWYDNLGINIFPLHSATSFASEDTKNTIIESDQDFKYKANNGKYEQRYNFNWMLDYHKLINEISGQKVNVILVSGRVIRLTKTDEGLLKGFEIDLFDLEKISFDEGSGKGNSELFLQFADSDELNVNGYDYEVDWTPQKLDRLALNISLTFGENSITMLIKHLNKTITGVEQSDITITDQTNGDISFSTFVPGDGIYVLGKFNKQITTACLYIQSTIYIGCKRFSFAYSVVIEVEMVSEYDEQMVSEYDEQMIDEN